MQLGARLPVVIVLAAGRGKRLTASGATIHKLQALLAGKPAGLSSVRCRECQWPANSCGAA